MRPEALPFEVDYFAPRPHRTSPPLFHVLSHAHRDHLTGLSTHTPSTPIYCTRITANLAHLRTGFPLNRFTVLPYHVKYSVPNIAMDITLLPADHIPGSAMILVSYENRTVLHTGDFFLSPQVYKVARQMAGLVDFAFIDATYCHPSFKFLGRQDAENLVIGMVAEAFEDDMDVWIVAHLLGKEDLILKVAEELGCELVVSSRKYQIMKEIFPLKTEKYCRRDPGRRKHVKIVPPWKASRDNMLKGRVPEGIKVIAPTGCHNPAAMAIGVAHVSYSEHCDYSALRDFVGILKPGMVRATPETRGYCGPDGSNMNPKHWLQDLTTENQAVWTPSEQNKGKEMKCESRTIAERMTGVDRSSRVRFS